MEDRVLFDANYTTVTQTVARFWNTTYQVRNIDSVAIIDKRGVNPVAVGLAILGVAAYVAAYVYFNIVALVGGSVLIVAAVLWQNQWPRWEYRLVLKTSGGESEVLITRDRKYICDLKAAIEQAFVSRA
jgi:hypothetical protein